MAKLTITLSDDLQADFQAYIDAQNAEQGTSIIATEFLEKFVFDLVMSNSIMAFSTAKREASLKAADAETSAEAERLSALYSKVKSIQ